VIEVSTSAGGSGRSRGESTPRCSLEAGRADRMPPSAPVSSRNGGTSTSSPGKAANRARCFSSAAPAPMCRTPGQQEHRQALDEDAFGRTPRSYPFERLGLRARCLVRGLRRTPVPSTIRVGGTGLHGKPSARAFRESAAPSRVNQPIMCDSSSRTHPVSLHDAVGNRDPVGGEPSR
jgi:hypothetical protein